MPSLSRTHYQHGCQVGKAGSALASSRRLLPTLALIFRIRLYISDFVAIELLCLAIFFGFFLLAPLLQPELDLSTGVGDELLSCEEHIDKSVDSDEADPDPPNKVPGYRVTELCEVGQGVRHQKDPGLIVNLLDVCNSRLKRRAVD